MCNYIWICERDFEWTRDAKTRRFYGKEMGFKKNRCRETLEWKLRRIRKIREKQCESYVGHRMREVSKFSRLGAKYSNCMSCFIFQKRNLFLLWKPAKRELEKVLSLKNWKKNKVTRRDYSDAVWINILLETLKEEERRKESLFMFYNFLEVLLHKKCRFFHLDNKTA